MNVETMIKSAEEALKINGTLTLQTPRPFKNKPKGFPRGCLLCSHEDSDTRSYDPKKILAFLDKNGLM
jgi:hypothetical protein